MYKNQFQIEITLIFYVSTILYFPNFSCWGEDVYEYERYLVALA